MNIVQLLEQRRQGWRELESLCDKLGTRKGITDPQDATRFAALYRAACADLALSEAYQLPPANVTYLHRLVARAHNQLYRSKKFSLAGFADIVIKEAPRQIFCDPCVRICALLFFGLFLLSMMLGLAETRFPEYPERVCGDAMLEQMEASFALPMDGNLEHYLMAASHYIRHNTGIGLKCFAFGVLIIPCLFTLAYNGVVLGAAFGYMAREGVDGGENFLHFVTAHGPFELTAIALSGAAGLRVGIGLISTAGFGRFDSLRINARKAIPVIAAAAVLFFLAALTEGFLSPSPAPYLTKAIWAIFSSGLLTFYFVVLGFPRDGIDAA